LVHTGLNYLQNLAALDECFNSVVVCFAGEHPAAMQRGKNSAAPCSWSHLSAGLVLFACCSPPRAALVTLLALGVAGHILGWAGT
jgi:hypothetical protein